MKSFASSSVTEENNHRQETPRSITSQRIMALILAKFGFGVFALVAASYSIYIFSLISLSQRIMDKEARFVMVCSSIIIFLQLIDNMMCLSYHAPLINPLPESVIFPFLISGLMVCYAVRSPQKI